MRRRQKDEGSEQNKEILRKKISPLSQNHAFSGNLKKSFSTPEIVHKTLGPDFLGAKLGWRFFCSQKGFLATPFNACQCSKGHFHGRSSPQRGLFSAENRVKGLLFSPLSILSYRWEATNLAHFFPFPTFCLAHFRENGHDFVEKEKTLINSWHFAIF